MADERYEDAVKFARGGGRVSPITLQRELTIAYGHAISLIDEMERRGVIEKWDGSYPRKLSKQYEMGLLQ